MAEKNLEKHQDDEKELAVRFGIFEQQIRQIQQQLEAVEQALLDMTSLNLGLDEVKKDKDILAPIGRGIFANAKLLSEDLIVDVGGKNYVKKSIPETKNLIEEQIKKLERVQKNLNEELNKINEEITKMMAEYQEQKS